MTGRFYFISAKQGQLKRKKKLLFFLDLMVNSQEYKTCLKRDIDKPFGELIYIPIGHRANDEECNWTFSFNKTDNEFVLVLDAFYLFQGTYGNNSIQLPHGKIKQKIN